MTKMFQEEASVLFTRLHLIVIARVTNNFRLVFCDSTKFGDLRLADFSGGCGGGGLFVTESVRAVLSVSSTAFVLARKVAALPI